MAIGDRVLCLLQLGSTCWAAEAIEADRCSIEGTGKARATASIMPEKSVTVRYERAFAADVPARWVVGDAGYGSNGK